MPEYRVVIEETVIERRAYEIEADDPERAAKEARNLWIVQGKLPKTLEQHVEDRNYTVMHTEKLIDMAPLGSAYQVLGVFDESDLEIDE